MSERGDAWQQVADRFRTLGHKFRGHYGGGEDEAESDESAAGEEVKNALQNLGESLDRVFTATGDALRDPDVRDESKRAAQSLVDALGLTFSELGEDLKRTFGRTEGGDAEAGEAADAPGAGTDDTAEPEDAPPDQG